jgi:hypothetical protein
VRSLPGNDAADRDAEDAAVVIAVLAALSGGGDADPGPSARTVWADPGRRQPLWAPGASAWWASGLPR